MTASSEIDYESFNELIRQLRAAGHNVTANKLDFLLHQVAWTSSYELVGELGLIIVAFERDASNVPAKLHGALKRSLSIIKTFWPDIGSTAAEERGDD